MTASDRLLPQPAQRRPLLPYLILAFGILALGFSAIFVRWADAPGPVVGFYRIGLATLILTLPQARNFKHGAGHRLFRREAVIFPFLGGLFMACDQAIWNTAVRYTTAANATLMNNTAPLWVALFALLVFRERLKGVFWLGLALALSGAAAVLGSDFLRHPTLGWGDLLALLSAVFYSGYFIMTQRGREKLDTLSYVWGSGLTCAIALLILSLVLGMPLGGYPPVTYLALLGAAVISQIGGYLATGYALGHLPASLVSPTMIGQPVMTALLALLLLGENLKPAQWAGGIVVLLGIFLVHRSMQRE